MMTEQNLPSIRLEKIGARYGVERLGFQHLEIVVHENNLASQKDAQKIGAVREGLLRSRLLIQGSPRDAYMHSLIPSDFGIQTNA